MTLTEIGNKYICQIMRGIEQKLRKFRGMAFLIVAT